MLIQSSFHMSKNRKFHDAWAFVAFVLVCGSFLGLGVYGMMNNSEVTLEGSKMTLLQAIGFNVLISLVLNLMMFTMYSVAPKLMIYIGIFGFPVAALVLSVVTMNMPLMFASGLNMLFAFLIYLYVMNHIDVIAQLYKTVSTMVNRHIFGLLFNFLLALVINIGITVPMVFNFSTKETESGLFGGLLVLSFFWTDTFFMYFYDVFISSVITGELLKNTSTDEQDNNMSVIGTSYYNTFLAMGSIAYGSLIIALIKTLRYFVNEQRSDRNRNQPSVLKTVFLCIADFILSIIEAFVHIVNKFTFTYLAITGDSYKAAMKNSFEKLNEKENVAFKSFVIAERVQLFIILMQAICVIICNIGYVMLVGKDDEIVIISAVLGGILAVVLGLEFCNVMSAGSLALSFLQILAPQNIKVYDIELHNALSKIQDKRA